MRTEEQLTMLADIKQYIDDRDSMVEQKIKIWIISSLLANVFALAPIIFFLGSIYQTINTSMQVSTAQQLEMAKRGLWMEERMRWEQSVMMALDNKGIKLPQYHISKEQ